MSSSLYDSMDCSLPGFSVHGILQARILEWVVVSFSKCSSWRRDRTQVSCTAVRFFTVWATREAHDQTRQCIKKQRHYFANKGPYSKSYGFSITQVWMWDLDHKKGWMPKNWCFWTVVLEKTLESPLDCKEIKLVNPRENHSWIFLGRTEAEAEAHILWPLDAKNLLIRKDSDAVKNLWQEEKGMTENKTVG